MDFPKLNDTEFPYLDNVDVFALKNDYDFKRFDNAQMTIHVLNVPWDMGEAHVGQRTITGIGNVVKFENDAARDSWFRAKRYATTPEQWATGEFDGFQWVTKFRHFHNGDDLKIPLPFDVVAKFNYVWIEYEPAPDASNSVDYEYGGILTWFWFIRNFQMISVNTTSCVIKRDTWTTYINHIQFKGFFLEQGHYPIANSNVDRYLNNPIENNSGLLEEDVSYGELSRIVHSEYLALNEDNIKAVIVTSANPTSDFGLKSNNTWTTPNGYKTQDGQPSYWAFAIAVSSLNTFIANVTNTSPQFAQTIKAIFFVSENLITIGSEFTFCNVTCNRIAQKNSSFNLIDLAKEQFGYSSKYAHLAKLYTYPYAALELVDDTGAATLVKIEDTSGNISLRTSMNLAFPWINIDGRLLGIGSNEINSITFNNITSHTFSFGGKWYEHLRKWNIPTFGITQAASKANDYMTHYDRLQAKNDADTIKADTLAVNSTANTNALASNDTTYTNNIDSNEAAYENALASNATANTNALNANATANTNALNSNATANTNALTSNATAKTNSDAIADMSVTNTAVQNATNTANNATTNEGIDYATRQDIYLNGDNTYIANTVTEQTTNNQVDAAYAGAAISGIGGLLGSAASGAASGVALGPVGIVGGAVAGLAGGAIGAVSGQMQAAVSNNLLESQAAIQVQANYDSLGNTDTRMLNKSGKQIEVNSAITTTNNTNNTTQTANNAGLMKANATRDKTTADANANREKSTADTNANNEKATADTNANNEKATADANALREWTVNEDNITRELNTADANANREKATADANANRDYDNSITAINNQVKQAAINAPFEFGEFYAGDTATTRPLAMFSNVITQSKDAIEKAGDYFLRYGYRYNKYIDFSDFNLMPKFTYWKCSDVWVYGLDMSDEHMDEIRFFLMGGVTVWRKPEFIGTTSIYENV